MSYQPYFKHSVDLEGSDSIISSHAPSSPFEPLLSLPWLVNLGTKPLFIPFLITLFIIFYSLQIFGPSSGLYYYVFLEALELIFFLVMLSCYADKNVLKLLIKDFEYWYLISNGILLATFSVIRKHRDGFGGFFLFSNFIVNGSSAILGVTIIACVTIPRKLRIAVVGVFFIIVFQDFIRFSLLPPSPSLDVPLASFLPFTAPRVIAKASELNIVAFTLKILYNLIVHPNRIGLVQFSLQAKLDPSRKPASGLSPEDDAANEGLKDDPKSKSEGCLDPSSANQVLVEEASGWNVV